MRGVSVPACCLLLIGLIGCQKKQVYEGVYEGLHMREEVVHPADDPVPSDKQSYDAYMRERKKALEEKDEAVVR